MDLSSSPPKSSRRFLGFLSPRRRRSKSGTGQVESILSLEQPSGPAPSSAHLSPSEKSLGVNSSHGTVRARVAKKWRPLSTHTVADAQGRVLCSLDPTTHFRVVQVAEFQALCGREEAVAVGPGPGVDQTSGSIELLPPLGVAGGMYSKSQADSSSPMRATFHQSRAVAVHPLASFLMSLSESPRLPEPLPGNPLLEAANERIRLLEAQLRFKDLQLSRFPVKAETDLGFFTDKPPATCIGEMHKHPRDLYLPVVSWMAYLAAMAYLSPVSVRQVLYDHWPQSGLPQPSSLQFFSNLDTDTWAFGFCYPSSKEVVIAFRGTVSDENWSTNLDIKQCPISPIRQHYPPEYSSLLIHQGFNRAFLSIWPEVLCFIQRTRSTLGPNTRFAICGHSLGGALASLCFLYLTAFFPDIQIDQVVTFGQPRFGRREVIDFLEKHGTCKLIRIRNQSDGVPLVPPKSFGFVHLSRTTYVTADGTLLQNLPRKSSKTSLRHAISHHSMKLYMELVNRGLGRLLRFNMDFDRHMVPNAYSLLFFIRGWSVFGDLAKSKRPFHFEVSNIPQREYSVSALAVHARTVDLYFSAEPSTEPCELSLYPVWLGDRFVLRLWHRGKPLGHTLIAVHSANDVENVELKLVKRDAEVGTVSLSYNFLANEAQTSQTALFGQPLEALGSVVLRHPIVRTLRSTFVNLPHPIIVMMFAIARRGLALPGAWLPVVPDEELGLLKAQIDRHDFSYFLLDDTPVPGLIPRVFFDYLRELPSPLVPYDLYSSFARFGSLSEFRDTSDELQKLFAKLPPINLLLIRLVLRFSFWMSQNSYFTGVGLEEIVAQFRPVFFQVQHPLTGERMHILEDIPALEKSLMSIALIDHQKLPNPWHTTFAVSSILASSTPEYDTSPIIGLVQIYLPRCLSTLLVTVTASGVITLYLPAESRSPVLFSFKPQINIHCSDMFYDSSHASLLFLSGIGPTMCLDLTELEHFDFGTEAALPLRPFTRIPAGCTFCAMNNASLYFGDQLGRLHVLGENDARSRCILQTHPPAPITRLLSIDEAHIVIGNSDGAIFIWNNEGKPPPQKCDDLYAVASPLGPESADGDATLVGDLYSSRVTCIEFIDDRVWACIGGKVFKMPLNDLASFERLEEVADNISIFGMYPYGSRSAILTGNFIYKLDLSTSQLSPPTSSPNMLNSSICLIEEDQFSYKDDPPIWVATYNQLCNFFHKEGHLVARLPSVSEISPVSSSSDGFSSSDSKEALRPEGRLVQARQRWSSGALKSLIARRQ